MNFERYELRKSPFAQRPTQKEVAALLGETRDDMRRLVNYKDQFVVRRQIVKGGKVRDLVYPEGRLRVVHEKFKFHLNKIILPDYIYSPRRGRTTRDNAILHLEQDQYLTLDCKQFYPSTTAQMVKGWLVRDLGMYDDVAGLLAHICTIDGIVSFGSPLTPVLVAHVHRRVFDEIADLCRARGLRLSLWVDDITISGKFVPREVLEKIRSTLTSVGLKTHKIKYHSGKNPVFITGIGVVGRRLIAPNRMNLKLKELWADFYNSQTNVERYICASRLLSEMGTVRYIVGRKSKIGQKMSSQMNGLRQQRNKMLRADLDAVAKEVVLKEASATDAPWV